MYLISFISERRVPPVNSYHYNCGFIVANIIGIWETIIRYLTTNKISIILFIAVMYFKLLCYLFLSHTCGVYHPCDKLLLYKRVILYQILPVRTTFDTASRFNASVTWFLKIFQYVTNHYFYIQQLIYNAFCRGHKF